MFYKKLAPVGGDFPYIMQLTTRKTTQASVYQHGLLLNRFLNNKTPCNKH